MSPPPASTLRFGPMRYWEPAAGVGKPMSWHVHAVGHRLGGGAAEPVSETLSKVSVTSVPPFESTASPATMEPAAPNVSLEPITADHAMPSGDVKVVKVFWYRVICRYA